MGLELAQESVWFDKWRYDDAEANFYGQKPELTKGIPESKEIKQKRSTHCGALSDKDAPQPGSLADVVKPQPPISLPPFKSSKTSQAVMLEKLQECNDTTLKNKEATAAPLLGSLATQIARAREDIQNSRAASGRVLAASAPADVLNRMTKLEGDNDTLRKTVKNLEKTLSEVTKRLASLECSCKGIAGAAPASKSEPMEQDDDDDDEVDLFGSDDEEEEDAEAARVREERLKAYADKKSKKAGPIAKSSVLLDCKPWDDETDLKLMEAAVRGIKMDGLNWGAAKAVPLAFGIHKLSILCTVEDEKVSIDDLSETITTDLEEYVQSVDIAAFNKC